MYISKEYKRLIRIEGIPGGTHVTDVETGESIGNVTAMIIRLEAGCVSECEVTYAEMDKSGCFVIDEDNQLIKNTTILPDVHQEISMVDFLLVQHRVMVTFTLEEWERIREAREKVAGKKLTNNQLRDAIASICVSDILQLTNRTLNKYNIEQKLRADFPDLDIHVGLLDNGQYIYHFGAIPTIEEKEAVNQRISEYMREMEEGKNE